MIELEAEPRASNSIAAIKVGGVDVDLDRVLASLSIRHGRDDVDGPIQASTATLSLRNLDRSELDVWEVGRELRIDDANNPPLFAGVVSDRAIADDDPREWRLNVIATGGLAVAGRRSVGGHAWPAEAWGARVTRIMTEAGLASRLTVQAPSPDYPIAATVPTDPDTGYFESYAALDALDLARADIGATVFDDGDRIMIQAFDARRDLYPVLPLDPAVVLYSPPWGQTLDVANRIVLGYGYGAGTITVDDPVSQTMFGVRWTGLFDSGLADSATATDRARAWLERVAYPRWKLPGLTLLDPADLHIGQMLELTELPPSAPFATWNPVVEGWEDVIEGPHWNQNVVLSDPVLSGLGLAWDELPATLLWSGVDPSCLWRDAYYLGNLEPGRAA